MIKGLKVIFTALFLLASLEAKIPFIAYEKAFEMTDSQKYKIFFDGLSSKQDLGKVASSVMQDNHRVPAMTLDRQRHLLIIFVHGTIFPVPSLSAMQEWAGNRQIGRAHV